MVPLAQRGRRRHRSLAPALQRGPPAQELAILAPGGVQAATPPRPATRHPLGITVSIKPSRSLRESGWPMKALLTRLKAAHQQLKPSETRADPVVCRHAKRK